MATYGYTFQSGDGVTPTRLNDARTVSEIVNADIKSDAAIAGTKIAPDFGSQDVKTTGRILLGHNTEIATASSSGLAITPLSQVVGTNVALSSVGLFNYAATGGSVGNLVFSKSVSNTIGTHTSVVSGNALGGITFTGSDGTNFVTAAAISAVVDGTPGTNDMPGRLVFSTTADGASAATERMRINSGGTVMVGKTISSITTEGVELFGNGGAYLTKAGGQAMNINRLTNDGTLIAFTQDNTTEGSISVSGSTVSYNGAHLSRWSQLPSGAARQEILRGTVLSNIDEMCVWGDEQNEQLNRMKVSDVEGDHNASGVFQSWDDDDDTYTNDFYCAMTGDFVIRIAAGTTVQRGDLLMSAGDGTAKPQGDDIVRSKTVAKVTSTQPSCTYADGSYCVPCVLMAC